MAAGRYRNGRRRRHGGGTGTGATGTAGVGASATGSVTSVSKVASASSGVAGYPVVISFNADANAFYPGATVNGAIATEAKNDVVQVPTRAISTQNGKSIVTVATTGKVGGPTETRTVTTGITAGGQTEITSGLRARRAGGDHDPSGVRWARPHRHRRCFGGFGGGAGGTGGTTRNAGGAG